MDSERMRYYMLSRQHIPYEPTAAYAGYDFDVPAALRPMNRGYSMRTVSPWEVDRAILRGFVACGYDLQPTPPDREWWHRLWMRKAGLR